MTEENGWAIEKWLGTGFTCDKCGQRHEVPIRRVVIERGALAEAAAFVREAGWRSVVLAMDERTRTAAGEALERGLTSGGGVKVTSCVLEPDELGDVVADERSIVRLMLDVKEDVDAILAVGAGTIHDVVRFVCSRTGRAFVSVPTAASVDGFASVGAPLIVRGFKQTIPACAPVAIFADLDVLAAAPRALAAAGFGDMLGKATSLADWELGAIVQGEPYCELVAAMTRQGLQLCTDNVEAIAAGTPEGMRRLMEGLVLSGIAMLLIGHSRPASGAEHHLSHFWELRLLQERRRALLHGAKVGAAAVLMAAAYAHLRQLAPQDARARAAVAADDAALIRAAYGPLAEAVLRENAPAAGAERAAADRAAALERWAAVQAAAAAVPPPQELAAALRAVGGPASPSELALGGELVAESLLAAPFVRARFTVLRLWRLLGGLPPELEVC